MSIIIVDVCRSGGGGGGGGGRLLSSGFHCPLFLVLIVVLHSCGLKF